LPATELTANLRFLAARVGARDGWLGAGLTLDPAKR
jgi:hypothetical protein